MESVEKQWGKSPFWGIGSEFDPDWILTDEQKTLRNKLMDLCRTKIRPHAVYCDKTYTFPRESLNAMAELGLLGLIVPKELGGLGQNHVCATMIVETIARYGCPSTAMVYTMHLGACSTALFRYHNNPKIKDLLSRLDKDKLVGTLSYSDPATGGHFWFPLSSKVKCLDERTIQLLKYGSWATSSGFADWYTIQTVSPEFNGDYSNLSCFLVYKDEVRASTEDWNAIGMHGNMSGPLIVEGKFNRDRMVGPPGDGSKSNDECVDIYFLLLTSACWNGISMGSMDIGKKHVTRKAHADAGMRVCDYPTIQDYFGEYLSETNSSRSLLYMISQALDSATSNNDWSLHEDLNFLPRSQYLSWLWQAKFVSAKNVSTVTDKMMQACGGTGYKTELGLERLLRDGKAGWVMGPSNEVLRQFVGKLALMGPSAIDYWEQIPHERVVNHELRKMSIGAKKALAQRLMEEVAHEERGTKASHPYQDTDFENPFNTCAPAYTGKVYKTPDGVTHDPAFNPSSWTKVVLKSRSQVSDRMGAFIFSLPKSSDYTGCLPGQYVQVQVMIDGKPHERYFSPTSRPDDFGQMELVLRYETQGIISQHFKAMKHGATALVRGPCGGFEYEPNQLEELTLLASGGGITPGLQLIRSIIPSEKDKTRVTLLYYAENYDEILYREEINKYADNSSRLRVIYTLGEVSENWDGEEGFIDTEMIDKHVAKPNGIKHKIVMCGGPTMAVSCLHSLRSLGYPSESCFIYGQFGTEQIRTVYGRNVRFTSHRCDA